MYLEIAVTVTVPEDMTQVDPSFAEGAAVTLTGDQALKFTPHPNISET